MGQAIIGAPLFFDAHIPLKWWLVVWLVVLWYVWLACNADVIMTKEELMVATKAKIWNQICIVPRVGWEKCTTNNIRVGQDKEKVVQLFYFDFGDNEKVFTFDSQKIRGACILLEPD